MLVKQIPDLKNINKLDFPHLIILGAGASVAASTYNNFTGMRLPLMKELPDALELSQILDAEQLKMAKEDYEAFFDSLVKDKNTTLIQKLEDRTENFFSAIEIQNTVTLYDKLVLSLRPKDTIVSFNWDPLLPYAYRRNGHLKTLPDLWFLHGNVLAGVCHKDHRVGWNDDRCNVCGQALEKTKLLFPVSTKNYESDPVIKEAWRHLSEEIEQAYFITIFGYSAPKSDVAARDKILSNLAKNPRKNLMQIEIIDPNVEQLLQTNYSALADFHLYSPKNFNHSWSMMYPKLTCEVLCQTTQYLNPIHPYHQIDTPDLKELQAWAKEFDEQIPGIHQEKRIWQG